MNTVIPTKLHFRPVAQFYSEYNIYLSISNDNCEKYRESVMGYQVF